MSDPLLMWTDRQTSATTDEARRGLLVELAKWRAQHLTDIPATRRATYTIARIYQQMGNSDQATSEARALVSLYKTPPKARDEELSSLQDLLQELGLGDQPAPKVSGAAGRRDRERDRDRDRDRREKRGKERPPKAEGRSRAAEAKAAALAGDWAQVRQATEGARGASALLLRAYADLSEALEGPDEQRASRLEQLKGLLASGAGLRASAAAPAPAPEDDPLAQLIGEAVPTRRGPRMRVLERFAEEHPERIDELGEAALRHHVLTAGAGVPAPWLVGIVGRALITSPGERTDKTIAELRSQRAVAVAAYDEWPFERLQRVTRRAVEAGHEVRSLRRGVLAREEPDDRKLWTLRVVIEGTERMLVVAPHATEPYAPGKAEMLAERLLGLCPRALVLATGSGNEELRAKAAAQGLSVQEHDADDDALLAALAKAGASAPAAPQERLVEALTAEPFEPEAVKEVIGEFRRPDRALRPVLRQELADERAAVLLEAVHERTPPDVAIPEGNTLAVRVAAHGPATRALITEGAAQERFGGPGTAVIVDLTRVLLDEGWELHRVLRGPTRRESRQHPAVGTLASHIHDLWRLLVRRGDQRGEVWHVAELPPEGRAAVPLLLLEEHHRVVVLPDDSDLVDWWATLANAPSAIRWTGAEGSEVAAQAAAIPTAQDGAAGASTADNGAPHGSGQSPHDDGDDADEDGDASEGDGQTSAGAG